MPRVIGVDPGTITLDVCGLEDGRVFLDRSLPTREALADPAAFIALLQSAGPVDLIAGPSGYGLPLVAARDLTDNDLRLAYLAAEGEAGGIGGIRSLMRALARSSLPVILTPGVVHLPSVPDHRKVNRVDMGTADKLCAAVLALHQASALDGRRPRETSCVLLELGGAFSAAIAIEDGHIVDGAGGTSGSLGLRAAGALDGEVAFLAREVTKDVLFGGGALAVAGMPDATGSALAAASAADPASPARTAWDGYLEGAAKMVAALAVAAPRVRRVLLSGRAAAIPDVAARLAFLLSGVLPGVSVTRLHGVATVATHAAQGAALLADGLCGGTAAALVDALGIRDARGTVLDHLYVITADAARRRLGIV